MPMLGSIVQKGKLAACAFADESALNKVDLPTFGSPTIPHCKAIDYFFEGANLHEFRSYQNEGQVEVISKIMKQKPFSFLLLHLKFKEAADEHCIFIHRVGGGMCPGIFLFKIEKRKCVEHC
jgi:hypothetical protein